MCIQIQCLQGSLQVLCSSSHLQGNRCFRVCFTVVILLGLQRGKSKCKILEAPLAGDAGETDSEPSRSGYAKCIASSMMRAICDRRQ